LDDPPRAHGSIPGTRSLPDGFGLSLELDGTTARAQCERKDRYAVGMARPVVKHLHLASTNHAKTTAFYQAYFGFTFQKILERGPGQPSATIVRGPEHFQIFLEAGATDLGLPPWFHFGFLVPEAECRQLHARMVEDGVRITRPLVETPFLNFFCADPDEHEVQIYSDPAEL
jgi:predicted enzyme related to lactoylglutathione lyase